MRFLVLAAAAIATPALADDSPPALCTDRPTKATGPCIVPTGMVQVESDVGNWTHYRIDGTGTDTVLWVNPTLKYGLGPSTDVEVNWAPLVTVRTSDGVHDSALSGTGDVYLKVKQRLTDPAAKLQVAVLPWVKAPTARLGIGNGEWEYGVVLPVTYAIANGTTLTAAPEVDALADSDGHGHHAQVQGSVNIGQALSSTVTAYGELWTAQNDDPAGTVRQYSADAAVAWLARPTLQFDAGVNLGLNRATPGVQAYLGVSTRF
ncbi:transporter [Sphingomonas sp. ASV193]|uniref:transporter n=1 Tax=Sphingomonas sp. ASV193 TaxID=3144405 RepID=UPI0032E8BAC1